MQNALHKPHLKNATISNSFPVCIHCRSLIRAPLSQQLMNCDVWYNHFATKCVDFFAFEM